jgi:SAM-dependent methyltransferase
MKRSMPPGGLLECGATRRGMGSSPTDRFSDRVADYVRYRPDYPEALRQALWSEAQLDRDAVVADIGSGTGISSRLLLELGVTVFAVEPNQAMRSAAERELGRNARFRSVSGTAEATTLADASVDLVTAGQAFHWFNREGAGREFRRILRPGSPVAIFWNRRSLDGTPFLVGYEALLLRYGTDYQSVRHDRIDAAAFDTMFPGGWTLHRFPNAQELDREGLFGRVFSSSYTPSPDHPQRPAMEAALGELFEREAQSGRVRLEYETELYVGRF